MKTISFISILALSHAFTIPQCNNKMKSILHMEVPSSSTAASAEREGSRREFFTSTTASALGLMGLLATTGIVAPEDALASGGATAGKYT